MKDPNSIYPVRAINAWKLSEGIAEVNRILWLTFPEWDTIDRRKQDIPMSSPERRAETDEMLAEFTADPWKHRSEGMKCRTCMWFVVKEGQPDCEGWKKKGRCRLHAPTMNGYPVVFLDDWCGDHKLA